MLTIYDSAHFAFSLNKPIYVHSIYAHTKLFLFGGTKPLIQVHSACELSCNDYGVLKICFSECM